MVRGSVGSRNESHMASRRAPSTSRSRP